MDAARWNWLVSCHNMWCFDVESKALSKHSNNFPMCRHKNPLLPVIFHRQITPSAFFTVKSPARRCRIPTWDPSLTLWLCVTLCPKPKLFLLPWESLFQRTRYKLATKIYVYLNLVMWLCVTLWLCDSLPKTQTLSSQKDLPWESLFSKNKIWAGRKNQCLSKSCDVQGESVN